MFARPLTERLKRVMDFAEEHSKRLGHDYIGTEHLLLGLAQEQEGPHAEIFKEVNLTPQQLADGVAAFLGRE